MTKVVKPGVFKVISKLAKKKPVDRKKKAGITVEGKTIIGDKLAKTASTYTNVPISVESSNLKNIVYDNGKKELLITFIKGNRTYIYYGVPTITFSRLLKSKSKGEYFHQYIRYNYSYEELSQSQLRQRFSKKK